jgi:hypothetical protein
MLLSFFAIGAIWLFLKTVIASSYQRGAGRNRYGRLSKYIRGKVGAGNNANLFAGTGMELPLNFYQIVRYSLFGTWLIVIVVLIITPSGTSIGMQLLLCVLIFIATSPRNGIGSMKLPFYYIVRLLGKRKRAAFNKEIYRTISQMINLFTLKGDKVIGSNYIFEEIIKFSRLTRPIYQQMLSIWNLNRREEAVEYFTSTIGTKDAKDLSGVFLKLDYLGPGKLKSQLIHYRNNMRAEKVTLREKINERNGNLMYVLAIVSAIVVLLNFLVIVLVVEVLSSYSLILN